MRELTMQELGLVSGGADCGCGDSCEDLRASRDRAEKKSQWFDDRGKNTQAQRFADKADAYDERYQDCLDEQD
jgi:hypothetical protein